jgi:hypothetical protein
MRILRLLMAVGVLALFGCDSHETPVPGMPNTPDPNVLTPSPTLTPEPTVATEVSTEITEEGEAALVLLPSDKRPFVRPRRRMNVDQVDLAIRRATNGIGWDINGKNRFEALASTLGKPDYRQVVQEDLSPSPVFQKFLNDAARHVCAEMVKKELESPVEEHVLMVHAGPDRTEPDQVDANLTILLLRFHGVTISEEANDLHPWRWLYQSAVHLKDDPVTAWQIVCIGLIIHPDFYSY